MRRLQLYPDRSTLTRSAAEVIARIIAASTSERFNLLLSGGNTPRPVYMMLAGLYRDRIPWDHVHFYWGDERWVPYDSDASNYRMARETLLDPLAIPATSIHPIPTDRSDPIDAARLYDATLRAIGRDPLFDLVLLGIGEDGHTASLFPGSPALDERHALAVVAHSPAPPHTRITLTFPALESSRSTLFLVAGAAKRPVVQAILNGDEDAQQYPAAMLQPQGDVLWMIEGKL